ncbi:ABC transporter ATP-binding protein, partial [Promicromonospora sp. NPDC050262]
MYVPADQPAPGSGRAARAVRARNLTKTYGKGEAIVRALDGVDVDFEQGRFTAIM